MHELVESEDDGSPDAEGTAGEQASSPIANVVGHKRSDIRFWVKIRREQPENEDAEFADPAGAHGEHSAENISRRSVQNVSDIRLRGRIRRGLQFL